MPDTDIYAAVGLHGTLLEGVGGAAAPVDDAPDPEQGARSAKHVVPATVHSLFVRDGQGMPHWVLALVQSVPHRTAEATTGLGVGVGFGAGEGVE
jgi:hypothetical protein